LWGDNNLLGDDACSYKDGTAASAEYQALSGCTTAVPVETEGDAGTACGHWDEACFLGELMTGFATDGLGTFIQWAHAQLMRCTSLCH
jgi:hypothetical protein